MSTRKNVGGQKPFPQQATSHPFVTVVTADIRDTIYNYLPSIIVGQASRGAEHAFCEQRPYRQVAPDVQIAPIALLTVSPEDVLLTL